jgi:iron(III) transport system permease protein
MPASLFFPRLSRRFNRENVVYTVLLALFLVIVIGPCIGLIADLVRALVAGSAQDLVSSLLSERKAILLIQSVAFAAGVGAAGIGIGILVATLLWRTHRKISTGVILLVLALAPIPPYISALTWTEAIAWTNTGLRDLGAATLPVTGWPISFWVQLMALLPIAIFLSFIGLSSVDKTLVEAARMVRPDGEVLTKVILPLAAPSLLTAFGFLFILSCTDYSVPSLFGSSTYALDIFSTYSASSSAATALVAALPLLIITFSIIMICRSGIRQLAQTPNWTVRVWDTPPVFPGSVRLMQEVAVALFGLQILVIFSGLFLSTGSVSRFVTTIIFSSHEIWDSLLIALLVVLIALPLGLAVTREMLRPGMRGSFWWIVILVPIAIPSPLIGIGLISLWNNPGFPHLYGTVLMPVFASIARFASFVAIILFVQVRSIDPVLFDALRVFSRNDVDSAIKGYLPLMTPGIFVASGILAALTIGELGATLIVTHPGFGTLAIKIYNYLHYGAAAEVSGLCLLMALATLAAGLCVIAAFLGSQRIRRTSRDTISPEKSS